MTTRKICLLLSTGDSLRCGTVSWQSLIFLHYMERSGSSLRMRQALHQYVCKNKPKENYAIYTTDFVIAFTALYVLLLCGCICSRIWAISVQMLGCVLNYGNFMIQSGEDIGSKVMNFFAYTLRCHQSDKIVMLEKKN